MYKKLRLVLMVALGWSTWEIFKEEKSEIGKNLPGLIIAGLLFHKYDSELLENAEEKVTQIDFIGTNTPPRY